MLGELSAQQFSSVLTDRQLKLPLLECRYCHGMYSVLDVEELLFFASTKICIECYIKMMEADYKKSCFGKPSKLHYKTTHFGFNLLSNECKTFCPDRHVCKFFMRGQMYVVNKPRECE